MRKIFTITLFVLLCSSCSTDDFQDLSTVDDYMMKVTVYPDSKKIGEGYHLDILDYKTNSYGELISDLSGFEGGIIGSRGADNITEYHSVKEYKTVGIKIIPIENVVSYEFEIREIGGLDYPNSRLIVDIKETPISKETTIFYNFDTKKLTVN